MSELAFREHTWDKNIWNSVAINNEYGLTAFNAEDVILDIGAHIGAFAYAALDRGAGKVICVEPDAENFLYLRHNLHYACRATDRAVCISAACWRSDERHPLVHYAPVGINTGGGNTLGADGIPTAAISLDALCALAASLSETGRLRLIKLDCEGAEWPILYTAHVFAAVDAFLGEYHLPSADLIHNLGLTRPCTVEALAEFFRERAYDFNAVATGNDMGIFRAWKPGKEV